MKPTDLARIIWDIINKSDLYYCEPLVDFRLKNGELVFITKPFITGPRSSWTNINQAIKWIVRSLEERGITVIYEVVDSHDASFTMSVVSYPADIEIPETNGWEDEILDYGSDDERGQE